MFCFGLKDTTTNVVKMMKFLIGAKSPYEVLEETSKNKRRCILNLIKSQKV